ncbi:MAG TPA: response regulator [Candidatus Angelobacter sp.]|jgi:CheY-like chemotaxis protein
MSKSARKLFVQSASRSLRVLCVDDAEPALALRALILEAKGYAVTTSTSALRAAETFESGKFDVAVLDYEMPDMNGLQLAARLKNASPELKTILYTGVADAVRPNLPFIDAMVDKSDGVEKLLAAIDAFLPHWQKITNSGVLGSSVLT